MLLFFQFYLKLWPSGFFWISFFCLWVNWTNCWATLVITWKNKQIMHHFVLKFELEAAVIKILDFSTSFDTVCYQIKLIVEKFVQTWMNESLSLFELRVLISEFLFRSKHLVFRANKLYNLNLVLIKKKFKCIFPIGGKYFNLW